MGVSTSDDFSVVVLALDLRIGARPLLSFIDGQRGAPPQENWHDCPSDFLSSDDDFSDLDSPGTLLFPSQKQINKIHLMMMSAVMGRTQKPILGGEGGHGGGERGWRVGVIAERDLDLADQVCWDFKTHLRF
ncbi:hypothetical protein LOK49_LG05G03744 [Camellia lanceoleosa]|uniref:Uncharacterized protein n=1 Tax=Camellia lanceoleosa TaxID=1840588 RepID=A0ACC0HTG6_9ERIC|nr:hypothetical protein LOK49_LG05G03744 [Camellia lanceoleosa]